METQQIVSRDPEIMSGALVFAGTRVPVQTLIDYLAAGDSLEEFLEGIRTVTREQAVAYLEMTPEAVARDAGLAERDLPELLEDMDRAEREAGLEPLSEKEAMNLALEEQRAFRQERRERPDGEWRQ